MHAAVRDRTHRDPAFGIARPFLARRRAARRRIHAPGRRDRRGQGDQDERKACRRRPAPSAAAARRAGGRGMRPLSPILGQFPQGYTIYRLLIASQVLPFLPISIMSGLALCDM